MKDERPIPTAFVILAWASIVLGVLVLVGVAFYPDDVAVRLYEGLGATTTVAAGIAVLLKHRFAPVLVFAVATVMTVDLVLKYDWLLSTHWSAHSSWSAARLLFNTAVYWALGLAYRLWARNAPPSAS